MEEFASQKMEREPQIALREVTLADSEQYLALERKVAGKTYFPLETAEDLALELSRGKAYVVDLDGTPIGHVSYEERPDGTVYLSGFVIDPAYQGKGYGKRAMRAVLRLAANAPRVELATHPDNRAAIGLYRSLGFVEDGLRENFFGDGQPRLLFHLDQAAA